MTRHMSTLPCPPQLSCATSEQKTLVDDLPHSDTAVSVADCTVSEQNTLTDEMTPDDSAVSVAVCTASEQNNFTDEMARVNTAVSVADCTMSEQNTLTDEITHADTGVSVANCMTSGQGILADNPPPATTDALLTACGQITLVGDMPRVVSSPNRSAKQTANIINEAHCMYSSSHSKVESVDDSDYIPSDCSFVRDSHACSTGRSVEIPLLHNTTDMGSGTSIITRNRPRVQAREAVVATADTTVTQTGHDVSHIEVIPTNNDDGRKYDKQTYCYFYIKKTPQLKIA